MTVARFCIWSILFSASFSARLVAAEKLPLESPAKVLAAAAPAPAQPAMNARPGQRPVAAPTTPGGKLPQYQLGHRQRRIPAGDEHKNPTTRLFLALPGSISSQAILLVEANLTIDGQPFQAIREQRVQRLLKAVAADSSAEADEATVVERLRQSMKVTGEAPAADEVRWALTNWVDGPMLLLLNDNFQSFRAHQRPEFVVLDRDRDGILSAAEIQSAVRSLQECDLNRDDIIQFTEIARAAADVRNTTLAAPARLITLLPDAANAAAVYERLAAARLPKDGAQALSRFDRNGDGRFDAEELAELHRIPADLSLTIAFNSKEPEKSRLVLTAVAVEFVEAVQNATVDHLGITLSISGVAVNFQAVQAGVGSPLQKAPVPLGNADLPQENPPSERDRSLFQQAAGDQVIDQISLGAVNDGYPLLPDLDPNDDGRLTLRELRGVPGRLARFDRNHDGSLSLDETRAPIRVCFGLGPIVHRELAGIRSVHRAPATPPTSGPEWFVRMDRNKDNDLSRNEFPGTDEQFAAIDSDGDELISADEALAFDRNGTNSKEQTRP